MRKFSDGNIKLQKGQSYATESEERGFCDPYDEGAPWFFPEERSGWWCTVSNLLNNKEGGRGYF